jgi:hypothetical protein
VGHVIIGMDPHKRSATIEIIDDRERILDQGRFGTDHAGYQAMLCGSRRHPVRTWAIEGCNGIGRHLAQRLVADGETVVDVPAKPSARARVFSTGQGRKTDPVDAHSVAVVGLRTVGLRRIEIDDATVALRGVGRPPRRVGPGPLAEVSTGYTGCCWSYCPAGRRSSCLPPRLVHCLRRCAHEMSSVRPAAAWPAT